MWRGGDPEVWVYGVLEARCRRVDGRLGSMSTAKLAARDVDVYSVEVWRLRGIEACAERHSAAG